MEGDDQLLARLLLRHADSVAGNIRPNHPMHVASALPGIEQQGEGEPLLGSGRPARFERGDLLPAARDTSETVTPGSNVAATSPSFSARDQRRRRCTDVITSTRDIVIGLLPGLPPGPAMFVLLAARLPSPDGYEEQVYGDADHRRAARAGDPEPDGGGVRLHGISEQTFHRWKAKYGGMGVSEAQKLRTLEDENLAPALVLTTQPGQFLELCARRTVRPLAGIALGLLDPVGDRLRRRLELARQLFRSSSGSDQLDQLPPELRRIRWATLRHERHLHSKGKGVHRTGSTPRLLQKLASISSCSASHPLPNGSLRTLEAVF